MTHATDPIEFVGLTSPIQERFTETSATSLSPDLIAQLAAICAVSTEDQDLADHGRDWWPLAMHWAMQGKTPRKPHAVCRPTSTEHVVSIVTLCNENRIPLTVSAGRSGVCGAAIPVYGGVVLDTCLLASIISVDKVSGVVEVLPGMFGPDFENELCDTHGVTVGHFPQSFDISTVGGWVACRGAGQYSTRYGKIEDMVVGLEVVLANGTVVYTGTEPAGANGPDLTSLFVGSEGTLGVITRIWLRSHPLPTTQQRAAYLFPTFIDGINTCRTAVQHGATPAVLRLYDADESKRSHGTDGKQCTLLVLDEGDERIVAATLEIVHDAAMTNGAQVGDVELVEKWMHHRNNTSGLQEATRRGFIVDTMEVAAQWSSLEAIFTNVRASLMAVEGAVSATCHLSHSYLDGACLYFTFAAKPTPEFEQRYVQLWNACQRAALGAGANVSHHHGVGLNRGRFLPESLGTGMDVLQSIKNTLDPRNIFNPGKLGLNPDTDTSKRKPVWP